MLFFRWCVIRKFCNRKKFNFYSQEIFLSSACMRKTTLNYNLSQHHLFSLKRMIHSNYWESSTTTGKRLVHGLQLRLLNLWDTTLQSSRGTVNGLNIMTWKMCQRIAPKEWKWIPSCCFSWKIEKIVIADFRSQTNDITLVMTLFCMNKKHSHSCYCFSIRRK